MDKHVPKPPDARQEPGHSRESVHLDPPASPARRGGAKPPADARPHNDSQADGYADSVKNPPDSRQNQR